MWGANFHLLTILLSSSHFIEAAFWRYLFAVITLFAITIKNLPNWRLFIINSKGIILTGVFGLLGFNLLLFWGLNYTTPINASLILSLSPITTIAMSRAFFKSKITSWQLTGTLLGIYGVVFLISKGQLAGLSWNNISKGDFLMLLAMVLASCYHIGIKKFMVNISNKQFTLLTHLVCFAGILPLLPVLSIPASLNHPLDFWMAALLFGVLGTALTFFLWNKGVEAIGPDKASIYINIVPIATASIAIVLGEQISRFHYVSGLFILTGLVVFRGWKIEQILPSKCCAR